MTEAQFLLAGFPAWKLKAECLVEMKSGKQDVAICQSPKFKILCFFWIKLIA